MSLLSAALARTPASASIEMAQRARAFAAEGRDIVALSTGQPDFDVPDNVKRAAVAAVERGENAYAPVAGIPALRAAIARKLARENGIETVPSRVIVSGGAKQIVSTALLATLDPGDEVVIPAPCWVSYSALVAFCGARPVIVPTTAETGFKLTPAALASAITPRTKWLILNSPSNPTGAVYGAGELAGLGEVLAAHPRVLVMSDEIYEHIAYDEPVASFAAAVPALAERTLTVNGVSKAYAMMGWRIGYAAGPDWLIKGIDKLQGQLAAGASTIAQWAAVEALEGPQDEVARNRATFRERRDLVLSMLAQAPGLSCESPAGAFYAWISVERLLGRASRAGRLLTSDADVTSALLEEEGVALVPGSAFEGPGFVRLSFAASSERLATACGRIQNFCSFAQ